MTASSQPIRPTILLVVAVFVVAFASGFVSSRLLYQDRVREEGQRRFDEFLLVADRLGIIDHERLDELSADAGDDGAAAAAAVAP